MKNIYINPLKSKLAWSFAIIYSFIDLFMFSDPRVFGYFPELLLRYFLSYIGICSELLCPFPLSPWGFFIFNFIVGFLIGYLIIILIKTYKILWHKQKNN